MSEHLAETQFEALLERYSERLAQGHSGSVDSLIRSLTGDQIAEFVRAARQVHDLERFWSQRALPPGNLAASDSSRHLRQLAEWLIERAESILCPEESSAPVTDSSDTLESLRPGEFTPGQQLGEFLLRSELGHGGMSVVYRAFDPSRQADVALKVLNARYHECVSHLKAEFRRLCAVVHPNVVRFFNLCYRGEQWLLTMELVEGQGLLAWLDGSANRITAFRALLAQIIEGLFHLHSVGLVHRDIKPSNVIVDAQGQLKILDFGVAAPWTGTLLEAQDARRGGTLHYMAPEALGPGLATPASDWYSVGILTYEALLGVRPFRGSLVEMLAAKRRGLTGDDLQRLESLPGDLRDMCCLLLAPDPQQRLDGAQMRRVFGRQFAEACHSASEPAAPLIGRDEPLQILREALEDVQTGKQFRVVCVSGEAGVGKTSLVESFLRAEAGRALVVHAKCHERESVPFNAWDGVVDRLAVHLAGESRLGWADERQLLANLEILAALFPTLKSSCPIPPATTFAEAGAIVARAGAALGRILTWLSRRTCVLVWLDDMQWADDDSRALLAALLASDELPLLFLGSCRAATPVAPMIQTLQESKWSAALRQISLAPFDLQQTEQYLQSQVAESCSPEWIAEVNRRTGGNPYLLARWLERRPSSDRAAGADVAAGPDGPGGAARSHMDGLSPVESEVLKCVAIAGHPLPVTDLLNACRLETADVAILDGLIDRRLLRAGIGRQRQLQMYHDLLGAEVLHSIDAPVRRDLHFRLACTLENRPDEADLTARHYYESHSPEKARPFAERAAQEAERKFAFSHAANCLEMALRCGSTTPGDERRLRVQRARMLSCAGHGREASDEYLRAADDPDARQRLLTVCRAGEELLKIGELGRGLAILDPALEQLGLSRRVSLWSILPSFLWHRLLLRKYRYKELSLRQDSNLQAELQIEVGGRIGGSLSYYFFLSGAELIGRSAYLAFRYAKPKQLMFAMSQELILAAQQPRANARYIDDLQTRLQKLAAIVDDCYLHEFFKASQALTHFWSGQWPEAQHGLREAFVSMLQIPEAGMERTHIALYYGWSSFWHGRYAELREWVRPHVEDATRRHDICALSHLQSHGMCSVWVALDLPQEARERIEQVRTLWGVEEFQAQDYLALIAECMIGLYEGEPLRELERIRRAKPKLSRLGILRISLIRLEVLYFEAVACLSLPNLPPSEIRRAEKIEREIRSLPVRCAAGFAQIIRAALVERAAPAQAADQWRLAAECCEERHLAGVAAAAGYQRRRLSADITEGACPAAAFFRQEGIRDTDKFVRMLIPVSEAGH